MTNWHAIVEYAGAITEDQAAELTERGEFVIATIDTDRNRTRVSFGVSASTLRQATDAALRDARTYADGIIAGAPIQMRIITDEDLAVENEHPIVPPLVDSTGAREILGVNTQQRMYEIEQRPDFPVPVETVSGGRRIYTAASIRAFGERWERKSGRPRKTT
ncbi:hypothetical protein J2S43_007873 [Catenuloplanes nepalensis]|uniref:Uncharacterized protein n=1 Tax=Catenuloplanes nepalensis TaxID=587533 RepID=A0ABT9N6N6_9ACTN|nr:hypothetical protein [Catenuloplanes nepalensis]MDP9799361.1 hypothetical protein [Catenuloplanes nepalensis]